MGGGGGVERERERDGHIRDIGIIKHKLSTHSLRLLNILCIHILV